MMAAITGVLQNGFRYEIDEDRFDDIEFFEGLSDLSRGNLSDLRGTLEKLLDREQKAALYEHLRDDNGRVSYKAVMECVGEIMRDAGEKNRSLKN